MYQELHQQLCQWLLTQGRYRYTSASQSITMALNILYHIIVHVWHHSLAYLWYVPGILSTPEFFNKLYNVEFVYMHVMTGTIEFLIGPFGCLVNCQIVCSIRMYIL